MSFSFDTRNLERTTRGLERFIAGVPEIAASEIIRQIREFAAGGKAPDGSNWKPYTPPYANRIHSPLTPVTKKRTGAFLASIKNRNMIIAPDAAHLKIAQGLERKRASFEVSPITPDNVLRLLNKSFSDAVA